MLLLESAMTVIKKLPFVMPKWAGEDRKEVRPSRKPGVWTQTESGSVFRRAEAVEPDWHELEPLDD
jgi:hypothetical protein